jgi:hypothetical protein
MSEMRNQFSLACVVSKNGGTAKKQFSPSVVQLKASTCGPDAEKQISTKS